MADAGVMLEFYSVHRAPISHVLAFLPVRAFAFFRGGLGRAALRVRNDRGRPARRSDRWQRNSSRAVERRTSAAQRQPLRLSAPLSPRVRGRLHERCGHRAQGHDSIRGGRQLSNGLAGRPRDLPQEMMRATDVSPSGRTIEERYVAAGRSARPCASRVDVGRSEGTQALSASRVDGRRCVVPVSRRRVCARLVRDCSRPSRLWPQRMAAAGLLVRRLHRGSRSAGQCVRASRDSESGGPQSRRRMSR